MLEQLYNQEPPKFSNWSYHFRQTPQVDVELHNSEKGDGNPFWRVHRLEREAAAQQQRVYEINEDDEKQPEIKD